MHAPVSIHRILVYEVVWKASHGSLVRAWFCSFLVFLKVKCLPKTMFSRKQRIHGMILLRSCAQNNALSRWILGTVWQERWCWWIPELNDPWNIARSDDRKNKVLVFLVGKTECLDYIPLTTFVGAKSGNHMRLDNVSFSAPPKNVVGMETVHALARILHVCVFNEHIHTDVAWSMCASSMNAFTPTPPTPSVP